MKRIILIFLCFYFGLLLGPGSAKEISPLIDAVRYDRVDEVRRLLKEGENANPRDQFDYTPLHYAAGLGFSETTALLIENGADVDARADEGLTALLIASIKGYTDVAEALIRGGADVDSLSFKEQVTPLQAAAKLGNMDVVQLLVRHGARVDLKDQRGGTALQYAIQNGHNEIVEFLKTKGKH